MAGIATIAGSVQRYHLILTLLRETGMRVGNGLARSLIGVTRWQHGVAAQGAASTMKYSCSYTKALAALGRTDSTRL